MKCGSCKGNHSTVGDVRKCYDTSAGVLGHAAMRQTETVPEEKKIWPKFPEVGAGRYAVYDKNKTLFFFRVDRPTKGKWRGYTFVKVASGENWMPVKDRDARKKILERIALSPEYAMKRYADKMVRCGMCGKRLTDQKSRDRGIGPECWKKRS